ncbi:hypothetical protein DJ322_RS23540 [Vibrio alginolyticus]|nr:hypothetical protein [Vibrio alginolyticus]
MMSAEVRGIDRFFPTQRAQVLFWATPFAVMAIFWQSPKLIQSFMPLLPSELHWLGVWFFVLCTFAFSFLLLVLELCVYASQNKHSRTHHYTYHAPEMNAKWLFKNARPKHYLFLTLVFFAGVCMERYL